LQTGCFCNPGACAKYVGLSHSDLVSNFEVHNATLSAQYNNNNNVITYILHLSKANVLPTCQAGHVCWDDNDVINGKPTGAVRISFGYMSTYEDAEV
jgi:molybdenum cofactor sulfurtransferase